MEVGVLRLQQGGQGEQQGGQGAKRESQWQLWEVGGLVVLKRGRFPVCFYCFVVDVGKWWCGWPL